MIWSWRTGAVQRTLSVFVGASAHVTRVASAADDGSTDTHDCTEMSRLGFGTVKANVVRDDTGIETEKPVFFAVE